MFEWKWAMKQHIWLSANYLPGKDNIRAHALSRNFDKSKEWKLNIDVFTQLVKFWGKPTIDLFASRINNQTDCYVSWLPDPFAINVDAFSIEWK